MGFWTDAEQGGEASEKSAPGWHRYKVTSVLRGSKARTFKSSKGDPQLMVVLTDEEGGEATAMFTLSERAAWSLAKFLSRAGVDLEQLDRDGVDLESWTDESFARRRLDGLLVWAHCEHEEVGAKVYTRLDFKHGEEVPIDIATSMGDHPEVEPESDDDDIPF